VDSPLINAELPAILIVLVLGILYRLSLIHEPVRLDEAYSMLHYAVQPLSLIVTDYSFPNNHILHSLVMHFTYQWFGLSDIGLRLPAFAAGVITLALMTWLAWDLSRDKRVALMTALFGSVSYSLVYYSVNGRGYSMQMMFVLAIAVVLLRSGRWRSPLIPILLVAVLLFGLLYTIPSAVVIALPLLVAGLVLAAHRRSPPWALYTILVFTLCGLMLLSAFGPVLRSIMAIRPEAVISPLPVLSSAARMAVDGILPLPLCGIALIAGLWGLAKKNADAAWLATGVLFGYAILLVTLGRWLTLPVFFDRSYTPLFPFAYVVMAMGIGEGLSWVDRSGNRVVFESVLACALVAYAVRGSLAVLRDPSRLYFPERPTMAAGRDLIPPLALTLKKGESIAGLGMLCDAAAAYYVTRTRGFHGYYSLFEPQKRRLRTIYILAEDPKELQPVWENLSSWSRWTIPQKIAVSGPVSVFRIKRLGTHEVPA
jgi:hypothetical protein